MVPIGIKTSLGLTIFNHNLFSRFMYVFVILCCYFASFFCVICIVPLCCSFKLFFCIIDVVVNLSCC